MFVFGGSVLNSKGNSIVSVLVASAVLSILSLGSLRIINSNIKANKTMQTILDQQTILKNIKIILSSKADCSNNFAGIYVNQVGPIGKVNAYNINKITSLNEIDLDLKTDYGAGLGIEKLELHRLGNLPNDGDAVVKLVLQFNKEKFNKSNSNTTIGSKYSKEYELLVRLKNVGGRVQECVMDSESLVSSLKEDTCVNIGGVWDPVSETCDTSNLLKNMCQSINGTWKNNYCDQSNLIISICKQFGGTYSSNSCKLPSNTSPTPTPTPVPTTPSCPCGNCGATRTVAKKCGFRESGTDLQVCTAGGWVTSKYGVCRCTGKCK